MSPAGPGGIGGGAARPEADVVVLGAGVAGLAAAADLRAAGFAVEVLEARDRVGGRVLSLRDPGLPAVVELGPEFVHGDAPESRRLLRAAGAEVVPFDGPSWEAREGTVGPGRTFEGAMRVLEAVSGDDRSFEEAVRERAADLDPRDVSAARAFVEGFFAADPARVRASALGAEGVEGALDSGRVPAGQATLPERLAAEGGAPVRTGWVARRLRWSRGRVAVEGEGPDGRPLPPVRARAAVVTLPVGVLAADPDETGGLVFEPALPGLDAALAGVAMGPVVRLTLRFSRPPWDAPPLLPSPPGEAGPPGFLHTPDRPFNVYWTAEPAGAPLLVAWSGGARARRVPTGAGAIRALALRELTAATGADPGALERAVEDAYLHDWRTDPFARGAYAYPVVGGEGASEALARPVEGTVFLAGEATSAEAMGTVEGALVSGRRAAGRAREALAEG